MTRACLTINNLQRAHSVSVACITSTTYDAPMPTKNPRLTMTLSPETAAQLRRLSELTGNSQASLVSELLEGQKFTFDRVILALEEASSVRSNMVRSLAEDMEKSQRVLEDQLGLSLGDVDTVTAPLFEAEGKVRRRKGRASTAGAEGPRLRGGIAPAVEVRSKRGAGTPTY